MLRTIVTADSGIAIKSENIKTIPLIVIDNNTGDNYYDHKDIDSQKVYSLRNTGHKLTTSCMTPYDMEVFFKEALETADQVIHLSMSDAISKGSFQVSFMAANNIAPDKIKVINTKQGGSGGYLVAEKACEIVEKEDNIDIIKQYIENDIIENTVTSFIVPDPSGYQKSGKGALNAIINMGIKLISSGSGFPLIKIKNGSLKPYKNLKAKDKNKYIAFFEDFIDMNKIAENKIAVSSILPDSNTFEEFREYVKKAPINASYSQMSAVIASYACKDTLGISYIKK